MSWALDDAVDAGAKALWAHTTKDNRTPELWDDAGPQEQEEVRQAVQLVLECSQPELVKNHERLCATLFGLQGRITAPTGSLIEQFAQAMWDYLDEEEGDDDVVWPAWVDAPENEREDTVEAARRMLRLLGPILIGSSTPHSEDS